MGGRAVVVVRASAPRKLLAVRSSVNSASEISIDYGRARAGSVAVIVAAAVVGAGAPQKVLSVEQCESRRAKRC